MTSSTPSNTSGRRPGVVPRLAITRLVLIWTVTTVIILATLVLAAIRSTPNGPGFLPPASQADARDFDEAGNKLPPETKPPGERMAGLTEELDDAIQGILADNADFRIGVALGDVQSGEVRLYGDVSTYLAASTAKVLTAVAYYHLVETGDLELEEPLGNYTAAFQLEAMINSSNDDSWLLLMDAIGFPRLIEYAASIGISYDPKQNLLTPVEMAILLMRLYSGDLINPEHTAQLLGHMQETNNEELIPAAVPAGVTVHHKYGIVDQYMHDVAILTSGGTAYSLAIYTENPFGKQGRIDVIQQLTREICLSLFE
ncbi:serine hydrolase [Arthrobacter rhizosphaerae]|uniref:serine hydrolase n=1 Tax=Arthrobacter rhizosphaerae TaxID=2855490 RepID=UPI001FF27F0F|nr:serine hydrolase [Arthrobacter rhizosphaerae]